MKLEFSCHLNLLRSLDSPQKIVTLMVENYKPITPHGLGRIGYGPNVYKSLLKPDESGGTTNIALLSRNSIFPTENSTKQHQSNQCHFNYNMKERGDRELLM